MTESSQTTDTPPADPDEIMREVRECVRLEGLSDETQTVEELRALLSEVRVLRRKYEGQAGAAAALRLAPSLDHSAFDDLDAAGETQDIPPPRRIAKIPPLLLLFKGYRKAVLKSQRLFNQAVYGLFRRAFRNFILIEKHQLLLLDELRRLDAIEARLEKIERRLERPSAE